VDGAVKAAVEAAEARRTEAVIFMFASIFSQYRQVLQVKVL
jgi:hypothetical protein